MCQGKMPLSVRERYEKMREQNNISLNIDKLIANFDKALSHPNKVDLNFRTNCNIIRGEIKMLDISVFGDSFLKGVIYENNTYKVSQNRFSNMCEDILGVSIENKAKSGVQ